MRSILAVLAVLTALVVSAPVRGQNLGLLLLYDDNDVLIGSLAAQADYVAWTPRHYKVRIARGTGEVMAANLTDLSGATYELDIYYTTTDCSDVGYLRVSTAAEDPPFGQVVGRYAGPSYTVFAIPSRPNLVTVSNAIRLRAEPGGNCLSTGPLPFLGIPLSETVNDPDVTGVQNTPYTPPLKLESRPLSVWFELFKDGFESGAKAHGSEMFERVV